MSSQILQSLTPPAILPQEMSQYAEVYNGACACSARACGAACCATSLSLSVVPHKLYVLMSSCVLARSTWWTAGAFPSSTMRLRLKSACWRRTS